MHQRDSEYVKISTGSHWGTGIQHLRRVRKQQAPLVLRIRSSQQRIRFRPTSPACRHRLRPRGCSCRAELLPLDTGHAAQRWRNMQRQRWQRRVRSIDESCAEGIAACLGRSGARLGCEKQI